MSRDAAEDLLKYKGTVGSFLVRDSESASGDYSLSVRSVHLMLCVVTSCLLYCFKPYLTLFSEYRNDDKIRHYKITNATGGFAVVGVSVSALF